MVKRRMVLCAILVTVGAMILTSCSLRWLVRSSWDAPKVVKVEGSKEWMEWSRYFVWVYKPLQEGQPTHLLLRGGDLLFLSGGSPFLYRESDGESLSVACKAYRTELGGKTVSISLENEEAWEWLEKAMPKDLSAIRLVVMEHELDEKRLESLRRLAQVNPGVGLWVEEKVSLQQFLPLFDPTLLFAPLRAEDLIILEKKRNVSALIINGDIADWSFLRKLPNLETLSILGLNPATPGQFPENLHRLKRLVLLDPKAENLTVLGEQRYLDELVLQGDCRVNSLDWISNFPDLKVLTLFSCKDLEDLSPLKQLKKLKWLGLPPAATQEQLENVLRDHPDLLGIELLRADGITDLSPLKGLSNLRYLMVDTPNAELDPLMTMKGLRWLAVSSEEEGMPRRIQEALPETSVVLVNPVCLGSGWILLLTPALMLTCWIEKRRRKVAQREKEL